MANDRLTFAIDRLERAMVRVEHGLATSAIKAGSAADPRLQERHERLRARVGETVADLDRLISAAAEAQNG